MEAVVAALVQELQLLLQAPEYPLGQDPRHPLVRVCFHAIPSISIGICCERLPDLFTGDSALTPSRGPTGDGYGPPIFPGGAVPPPVPAVGLGGAAAGKSPYGAIMEPTENPPTTVRFGYLDTYSSDLFIFIWFLFRSSHRLS